MRVDVNLQDIDIDQCSADGWFAGTHRCNTTTMEVSKRERERERESEDALLRGSLHKSVQFVKEDLDQATSSISMRVCLFRGKGRLTNKHFFSF